MEELYASKSDYETNSAGPTHSLPILPRVIQIKKKHTPANHMENYLLDSILLSLLLHKTVTIKLLSQCYMSHYLKNK